MSLSLDQFVSQVSASGLLDAGEVNQLRAQVRPSQADRFARELIKRKKLTLFQAQQCLAGKGKSLVLGNYVLLEKLGQGGMGMVLKAQHRRMKRIVALKVLAPSVAKSPELVARFEREVEAAARLTHPNIVAAYDADEAAGTHFLVMEYVDGKDLSWRVKTTGPLLLEDALGCILQAAKGLEFAHKHGVIHRDIKPGNLLLARDGTVKILDMGLARIEGESGGKAELTSTGAVMGTVDYMAPEQALSTKHADARSDIYSLGITLWYLVAGKPAFEGDSLMARLLAHREAPIPSLAAIVADRSPVSADSALSSGSGASVAGADALFHRMVAKNPEHRHQSMSEVVSAIEACLHGTSSGLATISGTATAPGGPVDAQLKAFLSQLTTSDSRRTVAASTVTKTAAVAPTMPFEATLTTTDSDVPTDPKTLTTLRRPGAGRRRTKPPASPLWRDRRMQMGAAACLFLLLGSWLLWKVSTSGDSAGPNARASQESSNNAVAPDSVAALSRAESAAPWQVLFDGASDSSAWRTLGPFRIEAGVLQANERGHAVSTEEYADFELEFDWRISEGGNSGVYYRAKAESVQSMYSGPEFQLLDNARHPNGKNPKGVAGSLFGVLPPLRDAARPVGEWNHCRVVARGDSVEHWMNGERILTYQIGSPAWKQAVATVPDNFRQELDGHSGRVMLQSHTGEIAFRNIRIRRLESFSIPTTGLASAPPSPAKAPFSPAEARAHQEAWARHLGVPVEWTNSIGMKFRVVPPGSFLMGSTEVELQVYRDELKRLSVVDRYEYHKRVELEQPQHPVTLTRPVYVGVHEVTQGQYAELMQMTPGHFSSQGEGKQFVQGVDTNLLPVESVRWFDLIEFCNRLSVQEGLTPCYEVSGTTVTWRHGDGYRLPTEAEWEFAARGGSTGRYFFDPSQESLGDYAWYVDNSEKATRIVGSKRANPFGLFDIYGNVWEWCYDPCDGKPYPSAPQVDPLPTVSRNSRSARGGSFDFSHLESRSTVRGMWDVNSPIQFIGFRVVRTIVAPKSSAPPTQGPAAQRPENSAPLVALRFDGIDDYVEIPSWKYQGDHPLTIEAWVRAEKLPRDMEIISTSEMSGFNLSIWKDDHWASGFHVGSNYVFARAPFLLEHSGQRMHVAGVYDYGQVRFYLNGIETERIAAPGRYNPSPRPLVIGGNPNENGVGSLFAGEIDEVRISRIGRYAGRFQPAQEFSADESTIALYAFDEGAGDTLRDSSGGNHHGKIHGAQWRRTAAAPQSARRIETAASHWVNLFNGRDLAGWTPLGHNGWRVENGVLIGETNGAPGWLISDRVFGNFELELEYRFEAGTNSGVFLRAWPDGSGSGKEFHEIQILDESAPEFAGIDAKARTGALWQQLDAAPIPDHLPDRWHRMQIHVTGNDLKVRVNGVDVTHGALPAGKPARGRIGLQIHAKRIEFRNVRARELDAGTIGTP